jgi:hypothetical protein
MMDAENADTIDATFPFREAVGSLLYLSTHTSPDISFAVGMLGRAMAGPSSHGIVAVKRLLRYLSGTRGYSLVFGGTGESTLIACSDADWVGDVDRKLTSGALHYFGEDLVHWTSKKQGCVSLSTAEAEYVAASSCAQDVVRLRGVLCDLNYRRRSPQSSPMTTPPPSNGAPVARAAPSISISRSVLSTKSCQGNRQSCSRPACRYLDEAA